MSGLYEFGPYRLDAARRVLTRGGEAVSLPPKTFDLLLLLAESQGRVLTKQELMKALWPDTFVEEANLSFQMSTLRKALGDAGAPWVETVPKHGYRFAAPLQDAPPPASSPTRRWYGAVATVAGVATLAYVTFWVWNKGASETSPPLLKPVPLTSYPGAEIHSSFSPDGNQVAFSWNGERRDNYDIYVKLIGAGQPLRLTRDPAEEVSPAWSPDGRWIAFVRRALTGQDSLILIPALGGPERKVADIRLARFDPGPFLCWSPDAQALVVSDRPSITEPAGLVVLSLETGLKRVLTSSPIFDTTPTFSPDARTLAFARFVALVRSEIYLLKVSDSFSPIGEPLRLTALNQWTTSPAWTSNGQELLFVSGAMIGTRSLWRVRATGPALPQQMVAGADEVSGPAVSPATGRLIYAQERADANIWRMRLPGAASEPLISSTRTEKQPQYSPDGRRIAFGSNRSGSEEIWVCDSNGANDVQLTSFGGPPTGAPRWSPDGQQIAFDVFAEGAGEIYVISAAGGAPRRLTNDRYQDVAPSWSRDGRWVYFVSNRGGDVQVWKILANAPPGTSEAVQITRNGASFAPFESDDGRFVYYLKSGSLWRVALDGGEEAEVIDVVVGGGGYALAPEGIYFLTRKNSGPETVLRFRPFAGGKIRDIIVFPNVVVQIAVSPDGRWLLHQQRGHRDADLMLVEGFR